MPDLLKAPFPWFGGKSQVASRERIWFSPHCLAARQASLF